MKYIEIAPSHHSGGAIVFGANPYTLEPLGEGGYNVGLIHDTAPSAVKIADAIDTIICAINFAVSFLLIHYSHFGNHNYKLFTIHYND